MYTAMIILDVLLASALIALVLLQQGKGADAGAAFGSGSSGTVFGAAGGASVMQKITTWVAVGFFVVTMGLSVMAKDRVTSAVQQSKKTSVVQDNVPVEQTRQSPAAGFSPEAATDTQGVDAIPEIEVSDDAVLQAPEFPTSSGTVTPPESPVIPE